MSYLIKIYIGVCILFILSIGWLSITVMNEIHEVGLKGIVDQIWYGNNKEE